MLGRVHPARNFSSAVSRRKPKLALLILCCPLLVLAADQARELFESAARALASGDLRAAERGFEQVVKLQPRNVGALGNLGVVYSRLSQHTDAVRVYRRALEIAPQDVQIQLNLGLAYLRQEDHVSARPWFERALAGKPDSAQIRELLATVQLSGGDAGQALNTLVPLQSSDSPGVLYLRSVALLKLRRRDEAREAVNAMFRQLRPAQAHLLTGRAYYESTLFEEAAAELEKAAETDPAVPGLWRELGKTYVSLRRSDAAYQALTKAVASDAADAEAQYFLGALLVQQGRIPEGEPRLENSRLARPNFWGAYYYLGRAALSRNAQAEAVRLFTKADELRPNDRSVLYQLARALKAAGRNDEARVVTGRLNKLRSAAQAEEQALVAK